MNKDNLLKLATFLDTVPEKAFTIAHWETGKVTKPEGQAPGECGFSGCAMGWAAHEKMFPGLELVKLSIRDDSRCYLRYQDPENHFIYDNFDAAANVMGIEEAAAEYLFSPTEYEGETATPAKVSKRIRDFVRTNGVF